MNMKSYQNFVRVYLAGVDEAENETLEAIPNWAGFNKESYYHEIGVSDQKEIKAIERERTTAMNHRVAEGLLHAKVFEVDDTVKRMLLLTRPPTDSKILAKVKLPFDHVFIDVSFLPEELKVTYDLVQVDGILVHKQFEDAHNFKTGKVERMELMTIEYAGLSTREDGTRAWFMNDILVGITEGMKIHYHEGADVQFFKDFVTNFLLFINLPYVEYVDVVRSEGNTERRRKKGLIELPTSTRIRLHGLVKRYASLASEVGSSHFNYRFWVRGHFRMHHSDRYKEARGKVIWLEPFIKGKGQLIDKQYEVDV